MCLQHQGQSKFERNEREFEKTTRPTITEFDFARDRGLTWTVMKASIVASLYCLKILRLRQLSSPGAPTLGQ